jgi:hypothetical protein
MTQSDNQETDDITRIARIITDLKRQASSLGLYELNPDIVKGLSDMFLGTLEVFVTAKRGKYPNDPALGQTCEYHLEHAEQHAHSANFACYDDDMHDGCSLDDDGLWHGFHETARVSLCLTRKAIVERNLSKTPVPHAITGDDGGHYVPVKTASLGNESIPGVWRGTVFGAALTGVVPGQMVTAGRSDSNAVVGVALRGGNAGDTIPIAIGDSTVTQHKPEYTLDLSEMRRRVNYEELRNPIAERRNAVNQCAPGNAGLCTESRKWSFVF